MNYTHIHLLLNHFPIIGTLIGTILLLSGVVRKNEGVQKSALLTIFIMALIAIPVFLTGEPAEESVEKLPGVFKSLIHEHEEAAEFAFWSMMVTGIISLAGLILQAKGHKMAKTIILLSLALGLFTSATMIRTGYLGGLIRHSEVRNGSVADADKEDEHEDKEKHY